MNRRIKLILEFEGTNYAGWQRQPNAPTVQQTVEEALARLCGHAVRVHASGRTDSGVHALGMCAHFDTMMRMQGDKFAYALNTFLPPDIRIRDSREVAPDFHARFDAKGKHYRYEIHNAPHACAIYRHTRLHVYQPLDFAAMERGAALVVGQHDFAAFQAAGGNVRSTRREIYRSKISRQGTLVRYDVWGNGFLYNMVRIIVGTLLDIGRSRVQPEVLTRALCTGARNLLRATAPAHGLTLVEVYYQEDALPDGETLEGH